jgi:hypothetical protein
MAFVLFKFVRRKIRDSGAKEAISTTKDSKLVESYLLPEVAPGQKHQQSSPQHDTEHDMAGSMRFADSHVEALSAEEVARHKVEARRRNIHQWKLMLGIALPNFLAAVDVTIVAPAIPLISSHFSMSIFTTIAYPSLY